MEKNLLLKWSSLAWKIFLERRTRGQTFKKIPHPTEILVGRSPPAEFLMFIYVYAFKKSGQPELDFMLTGFELVWEKVGFEARGNSNPGPSACQIDALSTELHEYSKWQYFVRVCTEFQNSNTVLVRAKRQRDSIIRLDQRKESGGYVLNVTRDRYAIDFGRLFKIAVTFLILSGVSILSMIYFALSLVESPA